jgi:hypothetical protein
VTSHFVASRGPGLTSTTIFVGVSYSSQAAAGDRAVGAAGAAPSYDTRDVFNTVINYANKHGGFAGREMKAVYYDYNLTDDTSTQDQSACAHWTQDNKVFAIRPISGSDILAACAEKAHAVEVGGGAATAATYAKYPHLIDPDGINLDRVGQVTVGGLYKAHYFTGKLGLVTWDTPNYRSAMQKGYLATLSSLHITPATPPVYIPVPQNIQSISESSPAISSAVAKFKGLGIDHVIIQDGPAGVFGGAGLTFEFMNQAKSQRYYPRYGQNDGNAPGWSVLPSDQMDKALAIDGSDYDKSKDAGWHLNSYREQCFKIEADAGFPVAGSNLNDEMIAGGACDFVFLTQRILNGLSSITNDTFVSAVEHLGTSLPSALVYGTKLMHGRRDGADMVRTEEYLDSCKCLKYSGSPYYPD